MGEETITFSVPGMAEKMSATLNRGAKDSHFGIILAHGAGGNSRSGHLPQIVEAFTKAGFWCLRFDCKPPILKKRVERFEVTLHLYQKIKSFGPAVSNHCKCRPSLCRTGSAEFCKGAARKGQISGEEMDHVWALHGK